MNLTTFPTRATKAAAEFMRVISGRSGGGLAWRTCFDAKKGMPKTDAASNVERYSGWVYTASTRNAEKQGTIPLRLYATKGTGEPRAGTRYGGKGIGRVITKAERHELSKTFAGQSARFKSAEEIEEIEVHPLIESGLLENTIDRTLLALYMELTGNSYLAWTIDSLGVPDEFTVLPSQYTRPVISGGVVVAYEFGLGSDKIRIPADQVAHNRFANPCNPFVGYAPLTAAAMAADRDRDMDIYEGSLNENLGIPPFIVAFTDDNVTDSDVQAYKREWNAQRAGVASQGKGLFTRGKVDLKNIAVSPREMAFLQGRKYTMEQVFGVFGIPDALAKTESVNRANYEAALYQWTSSTISYRNRLSESVINSQLIPAYNEPRLFVAYDSCVPEDREFALKQQESDLRNYVVTINEVRAANSMEPVEWGDVPLVQSTGAPLGAKAAEAGATNEPNKRAKMTARPGGGSRPFKAQDRNPNDAPDISGGANPEPTADERSLMRVTDSMQRDQRRDLLTEYDAKAPQYDAVQYDPLKYSTLYLDDAVDAAVKSWERGLIVGNLSLPDGSRVDVGSYITQPQAQEAIRKNTLRFLDSESESVGREFRARIAAGLKEGDSVPQIRKRIEGMFDDEARNARSLMIARTETARAIELGREASWAESGIISGKRWDASADSCPFCQAMHGREVVLGGNYWGKGDTMSVPFEGREINMPMSYGDTPAPPLHPNCRCVLEPIFIDGDG